MVGLAIFALLILTALVSLAVVVQGLIGTVDIISTRNFFLLGFINFQLTSAAITLYWPIRDDFILRNPATTSMIYVMYAALFLSIFMFTYHKGWFVTKLARRVPAPDAAPGVMSMLTLAVAFFVAGVIARYVLGYIPILGVLTGIMGEGLLAASAGLAMWAYAPRIFNVWIGVIAGGIILAALGAALYHTFGRRLILSVMMCVIWGAYHGHWKYLEKKRVISLLAVTAVVGLVLLAGVSGTRSGKSRESTAMDLIRLLNGRAIKDGLLQIATGQEAGNNSMWIMENYPNRFQYEPLGTLIYFVVQPVPRQIWEGKPDGLGRIAVRQAKAGRKRGSNYSIGAGLLGHIHRDNPLLALLPYAILYGLFFKFLDQIGRLHPANPFVVLPLGVVLGQVIGIARGEVGLFTFQTVVNVIGAGFGMFVVAKTMEMLGWRMRTFEEEASDDDEDWSDESHHDDQADDFDNHSYEHDASSDWSDSDSESHDSY